MHRSLSAAKIPSHLEPVGLQGLMVSVRTTLISQVELHGANVTYQCVLALQLQGADVGFAYQQEPVECLGSTKDPVKVGCTFY